MATNDQDILGLSKNSYSLFDRGDYVALKSLFANGAVLIVEPTGEKFKGPDNIVNFLRSYKDALPDETLRIQRQILCDNVVVTEMIVHGTNTGVWRTPMGDIQPTGKVVDTPCLELTEWKDNKIVEMHQYYDRMSTMNQLGINLAEEHHIA